MQLSTNRKLYLKLLFIFCDQYTFSVGHIVDEFEDNSYCTMSLASSSDLTRVSTDKYHTEAKKKINERKKIDDFLQ